MDLAPYAPAIIALAGTIVGAVISFGAQVYIAHTTRMSERRAVAFAIAAEIEAYLRLVEMRDVARRADAMIDTLQQNIRVPVRGFGVGVDEDLEATFPIFRASLTKLGVLGPIAGEVVTFYATASAVRSTAQAAERGVFDHMSAPEQAVFLREELDVFQECVVLGRRLIGRLKAV